MAKKKPVPKRPPKRKAQAKQTQTRTWLEPPSVQTPLAPDAVLDPKRVHELFALPGPDEPPPPPAPWPGYVTVWDPGVSVLDLRRRHRTLFYPTDWFEKCAFAKQTDAWKWKQLRLDGIEADKPFEKQRTRMSKGDEIASAREVVTVLLFHFLATGERREIGRLRCRDVLPNGKRVTVSFGPLGFDLGSVSDTWQSPGIGLAAVYTPSAVKKK